MLSVQEPDFTKLMKARCDALRKNGVKLQDVWSLATPEYRRAPERPVQALLLILQMVRVI